LPPGIDYRERLGSLLLLGFSLLGGFIFIAMSPDLAIVLFKSAKREVINRNPHIRSYEVEKACEDILEKRFGTDMMFDIMDHILECDYPGGMSNKK
jgi:hypothetical protein